VPVTNSTTGHPQCRTSGSGALTACSFWIPLGSSSGSHSVSITAGNVTVQKIFNVPQYTPPVSTILVTLTSISLGLVTQLVTKRLVDVNAERRMRAEVNAFNKEKREATVAKDKAKLDKLKKRELQVQQEQFKVQRARLKVTAITFVPLLAVYYLMATFLGGYGVIVAYTPIPIPYFAGLTQNPALFQVSLFWWYFLSSFTFSTMLSRLLHTTT
ncbi:MAG TPA: EMC3/TMCO1 family protein, partial [Nitrososphaerales archaeon]|nr:EMC3/TMCO1 family protein [Nitrososphaerales archaeon]